MPRAPRSARGQSSAGSQTRARKRKSATTTTTAKPAKRGTFAEFADTCPFCAQPIAKGSAIAIFGGQWMHTRCVKEQRVRERILAGHTFRSKRQSDWRLGSSPSSARATR